MSLQYSKITAFIIALPAVAVSGIAHARSSLPPQDFQVEVIDGDTLRVKGSRQSIRLFGVDACEAEQTAKARNGAVMRCGDPAVSALQRWTAGRTIRCEIRDYDRYSRALAVCGTAQVPDFSAELIRQGLAIAYRYRSRAVWPEYQRIEDSAKRQGKGIWAYSFDEPWVYRKEHKQ
ncbi:endonuclease YncB(thermonuclease family) [Rhizobium skierniewicense]|uniref:Endonuclease YncB(Thermonuclease family) n=1 Tax=Rhizobium skierniewicense TaxID=984260 RepID=A0A7W6G5E3_9HYPH|nr:thermonuclease family protein [Rhizobium skierniewicense]MBB3948456.1 endonuclease YncB(thermonuclease family) [Rhizobium skierniewicense]